MQSFQYGTTTINYIVDYKKEQKDVSLSVCLNDGVKVVAPDGLSSEKLHTILYKKAPWIIKKKNELEEIASTPSSKEFVSGEKFPYLGRNYRIKVNKTDVHTSNLTFKQGRFIADIPKNLTDIEKIQQLQHQFKKWYISHGSKKIEERLKLYCPKMGLQPVKITIKEQQKRWGTCTAYGAIYLNWRIMMAPMDIVDYVVVHELAHLKYPNHSNDYWRFVQSILPDYGQRKEWLRVNGPTLDLG